MKTILIALTVVGVVVFVLLFAFFLMHYASRDENLMSLGKNDLSSSPQE